MFLGHSTKYFIKLSLQRRVCSVPVKQSNSNKGRTQGGSLGLNPLNLIFYKNFITSTKQINYFRILFAC